MGSLQWKRKGGDLHYYGNDGRLTIGEFASSGALTNAISLGADRDAYGDGQVEAFAVHGGSSANLGSGYSVKCARLRHIVNCTTAAQETYGAVSQLVVKATTLSHLHAGIMGTFEGHTSGVVLSSAYSVGHAAVLARIGGHAAITATTPLAGFLAFNNAGAALASGSSVAFATSSVSASYPWTVGLYMPVGSILTAIRIGAFATGGATTTAINFSTSQNVWSDGQLDIVGVFGASASDLSGAYSAKCARFRHMVNSTAVDHETYGAVGQIVAKGSSMTHLHSGLMGTFEGHTSGVTLDSSGRSYTVGHAAVTARIGGHAAITATTPLAGFLAFNNASAGLASGNSVAFAASGASASYPWSIGLYCPSGSVSKLFESVIAAVPTTKYGCSLQATLTNGQSEGLSGYFEGHIAGTTAGHTYNFGSWINVDASAVLSSGHIIVPFEGGVYTSEAQATARIVFAGQHQAILTGAPASLHAWRLNTTQTVTALIAAANQGSVGYVAGAGTSGTQLGYIPIADIVGVGVVYIRVYDSAT